jgi:DNA-binding XRE family transcriptional regulator/mannose-6-phosphate isomerase-like protein (cupin superfamily)
MSPQYPNDLTTAFEAPAGSTATDRTRQHLADRVRTLRLGRKWTLDRAAERTGLSRSSLSKIEHGQMSPTYDALLKLARGFDLDVADLVAGGSGGSGRPGRAGGSGGPAIGRRSITRAGEGAPYVSPTCSHRMLAADLSQKALLPFRTVIRARSLTDYPDWDRHDSDDFLYVLDGTMIVFTELYAPVELAAGDSIYMDGRMGHACVSTGPADAVVLWVSVP